MNKYKAIAGIMMALFLATLLTAPSAPVNAALWPKTPANQTIRGPHFQNIYFVVYSSVDAEIPALQAGDIDIMDFSISPTQYQDLSTSDTSLSFATQAEQGFWYIAINCNATRLDDNNNTISNPTSNRIFRQALRYLTDKDSIIQDSELGGAAEKLDSVLATSYGAWYDPSVAGLSQYNVTKAEELLDSAGFVMNTTSGIRIDPATGKDLRPLVFYARPEQTHRTYSATLLTQAMESVGIPVDYREALRAICSVKVMQTQQYDLYTAGFGAGPDVDFLYDLFEGTRPPQQNYELWNNATYNEAARTAKFGTDYNTVKDAIYECQQILFDEAPGIFLYAMYSILAYKSNINDVVLYAPLGGYTANQYTYMLAYRSGTPYGGDLKVGCSSDFTQPSPLYEVNWWWDGYVVSTVYDSMILLDPYTFAEHPWLANSWTVQNWTAPGDIPGMNITFQLVQNATWHDGMPVTAEDAAFTILYMQEKACPVYISYVQNVVDAVASGNYLSVYMNVSSYWALHWIGAYLPIIPEHLWKDVEDPNTYQPILEGTLIGSGPYMFKDYKPGEYLELTANPNFYRRPADSTLGYTQLTLTVGETREFTLPPQNITGQIITNGTYTIQVVKGDGTVAKTVNGSVGDDGTYSATLDTTGMEAGTYTVIETLDLPVTALGAGVVNRYTLTLNAPDNTLTYVAIAAVVVVAVAAGYIVLRRRPKKPAA